MPICFSTSGLGRSSPTLSTENETSILDSYPKKYWWPLLHGHANKAVKMASTGDDHVLLVPLNQGWIPCPGGIPGDLWVFSVIF